MKTSSAGPTASCSSNEKPLIRDSLLVHPISFVHSRCLERYVITSQIAHKTFSFRAKKINKRHMLKPG